ncbi:MAG: C40 family peptidase, partial [Anaerolineales bacterium]|nr:C40 family peptidase [Anaerolineales bacterium]
LKRFVGVPYLWGGFSPFGYDCSGLAQTLWAWLGLALPRDADQQCAAGRPVDGPPQAGDLLFFGERPEDGDDLRSGITHVALALDAADVLHSAGSANGVTVNSLDPERPAYNAWLREHCLAVRRYA